MTTFTPEAQALKPCPFCGGRAKRLDFPVGSEIDNDPNAGGSCISCERCGASSPVHFDRKENLYCSWNDRTADAAMEAAGWVRVPVEPTQVMVDAAWHVIERDKVYRAMIAARPK